MSTVYNHVDLYFEYAVIVLFFYTVAGISLPLLLNRIWQISLFLFRKKNG